MHRSAEPLGGRHLLTANVEELVHHVDWRLTVKDFARDRLAAIARSALCPKIFAAPFNGDPHQRPLRRPLHVERHLRLAAERCESPLMAAALRPLHVIRETAVANRFAVPVVGEGGADATTCLADRLDRQPTCRSLHIADAHIEVTNYLRLIEGGANKWIKLPGWVDLGEPVELWSNAEARKRWEEERPHKVARIVFGAAPLGCGNVCERNAHVALHRIGGEERLRIHCVHIFDAVTELHGDAAITQGASNGVVHHGSTQGANVHGPRWGLRIVDDLGPGDACGEFVCPIHAGNPSARGRD